MADRYGIIASNSSVVWSYSDMAQVSGLPASVCQVVASYIEGSTPGLKLTTSKVNHVAWATAAMRDKNAAAAWYAEGKLPLVFKLPLIIAALIAAALVAKRIRR
jgi:hypothetical protein